MIFHLSFDAPVDHFNSVGINPYVRTLLSLDIKGLGPAFLICLRYLLMVSTIILDVWMIFEFSIYSGRISDYDLVLLV